ncbi:MAG: dihydrofolate reductase family protein [Dehalococcoidia bacterium]
MDRPYVILCVSASIDGRVSLGPNRTMFDLGKRDEVLGTREEWEEFYGSFQERYQPDVYMEGSSMIVKEGAELRTLAPYDGDPEKLRRDYLPREVIDRPGRKGWLAALDGRGRLRSGYTGEEDRPLMHLVSRSVSPEYLAFLRRTGIPYLVAGQERVDLALALNKMKEKLGVRTVLTSSGGRLAGALLKLGLLDEVHIRFNPVIIGGFNAPVLFASPDLEEGEPPVSLEVIETWACPAGHIFVGYRVVRG